MKKEKYGRYELKYFLPYNRINDLLEWIEPYVMPDKHAEIGANGLPFYTIQSVYFDSLNLALYFEKQDGLRDRRKFRIRSYCRPKDDTTIFFEIKYRYNTQVMKDRAPAELKMVENLLAGDVLLDNTELSLAIKKRAERFLYFHRARSLKPVVTVKYLRNPFIGKQDHQIRVTIDTNLVAIDHRATNKLFEPFIEEPVHLDGAILELKFDRLMPDWMRRLVRHFSIKQESISKYAHCVDAIALN